MNMKRYSTYTCEEKTRGAEGSDLRTPLGWAGFSLEPEVDAQLYDALPAFRTRDRARCGIGQ
jgi:hypothetical protein